MVNHQNTSTWIRCVPTVSVFLLTSFDSFLQFSLNFTIIFLWFCETALTTVSYFFLWGVWGGVAKINPLAHARRLTAMLNRQLCPLCWLTKILIQFEQHVPYVHPFWREFLAPRTRFPSARRRFHSQEKLLALDDRAIYNRFKTIFIGLDVQF